MEEHRRRTSDSAISRLGKIWPILVSLSLLAAAWGAFQQKVSYIEKALDKTEKVEEVHSEMLSKHEEALSVLPEMRADIKQILRELRHDRNR